MRSGKNVWYNVVTESFKKSDVRPGQTPEEKWEWRPAWNRNRVKASGAYTPYQNDGSEWVKMANASMAEESQHAWLSRK